MNSLEKNAQACKKAAISMMSVETKRKNSALLTMAKGLRDHKDRIIAENKIDVDQAEKQVQEGLLATSLYKRLLIDEVKLEGMAAGLESIAELSDPVGEVLQRLALDDGLVLTKVTDPIGLLGIIFESRPDVVPQVMGLSVKSGNAVIFKGGSEAAHSNRVLFEVLYEAGITAGLPDNFAGLIETREDVAQMLKLDDYFDLLIPRGSNQLVRSIMENTRIPVLGHADGICTMYIEKSAELEAAVRLVVDAKTQYPAVCNAIENLLLDKQIAEQFLPAINKALCEKQVVVRGDDAARAIVTEMAAASEEDWATEYNELILSVKVVSDIEEAIEFINYYGSGHTDAIVTTDQAAAELFKRRVDSSSVMVNASTRFADGFRYGKGAEIGISTNKTHARGPVGLEGLVIYKYYLEGNGHIVADYSGKDGKKFLHKPLS